MKVYFVYHEHEDNWCDKQAIFDNEERADEFNEEKNGGFGSIATFELNKPGEIFE